MIGDPPPEAATGQQEPRKTATLQKHDAEQSTQLGPDGGPETQRKEFPHKTRAGRPETELGTCKLRGKALWRNDFTARQWAWRSTAPTRNQRRNVTLAQPTHARICAGCGAEETRASCSATQLGAPAHVGARHLARPPPKEPRPEATGKTRALCGCAKTRVFFIYTRWELTPHTAPRRRKHCVEARWTRASLAEKLDSGTENATWSAEGATEDAEPAKATSPEPENAQPTRSARDEESPAKTGGPERGKVHGTACGGQTIAGYGDAVGPERSGTVKIPSSEELEPGREHGAPERPSASRARCAMPKRTGSTSAGRCGRSPRRQTKGAKTA